jgi:predicted  nucleic acid-binding Zn-ribbon protein
MPAKRARTPHDGDNLNERVDRIERQLANDRLDRIERAIERAIDANDEFRALVRGAFTLQQQQIAQQQQQIRHQQQQIAQQQEQMTEFRKTVEHVVREWQAYLRTIHPPQ